MTVLKTRQPLKRVAGLLSLLFLGGCASFSDDGGFAVAETSARTHLGKEVRWVKSDAEAETVQVKVQDLLKSPLSADDAVQIALLNNRGLQASYAELGVAEADYVRAGRPANPGFSLARLRREGEVEIERKFIFDIIGLFTLPFAMEIEQRRFEQTKVQVAREVLKVAAETRRAYIDAVAAEETRTYMEQVREAADASAELGRRMARVGNWGRLQESREQVFYAEAVAQHARAKQAALSARERLTRQMGLWGEQTAFKLPSRLPALPANAKDLPDVEATALAQRLDIQMAQREIEGLSKSLGLTRATGFINVLDLSYLRNSSTEKPQQTGFEIEVRLPIFDWGGARTAKAEHLYMQAVNRVAEIAVNARSEVREAYTAYRTHFDVARHYRDEIVPLRKRISDENLLRYNGMLIGVFELLADAREQIGSVMAAIEAQRAFWGADAELQLALTGGGGMTSSASAQRIAAPTASSGGH